MTFEDLSKQLNTSVQSLQNLVQVLSAAFADMEGGGGGSSYSTDETVVGKWIDGKPIYQRTWDFSDSPVMLSHGDWVDSGIPASENIKSIISAELKYDTVLLAGVEVGVNVDTFPIGFQKLDNLNTRSVSYCTLKYTKTTD